MEKLAAQSMPRLERAAEVAQRSAPTEWMERVRTTVEEMQQGSLEPSRRAVVELQDPELGRMRITVRMEEDRVRLEVWSDREEARQLLRDSRQTLEQSLARHQYRLEGFEVGGDPAQQFFKRQDAELAARGGSGRRKSVSEPQEPLEAVRVHDGQLYAIA
jgi:flagellar hook-length control protein FliK